MTAPAGKTALIIGASRGLGYALAAEYLARGWQVTATVRGAGRTGLHDLARSSAGRLVVETVDITVPEQVAALHERLARTTFDLLFVNAGVTNGPGETVADVATDTFVRLMVTNALSPMRVVEALQDLVTPNGTIAVMSSGQGSVANNDKGGFEVYRANKSALNQLMRIFPARHAGDLRTLLLMAPGWVQTDLGGPAARLTTGQSIPGVADTIEAQQIVPIVSVQNRYNATDRRSESMIDLCEQEQMTFLPWAPVQEADQNPAVTHAAQRHGVSTHQVVLAWLLASSPQILPIPGTGSDRPAEENIAAAALKVSPDEVAAISKGS